MKIIITLSIGALFASCSQSNPNNILDTVITTVNTDSIKRAAKFQSTSEIAYGKVKFGITKKAYDKLMPEMSNKIGAYDYMFLPQYDKQGKLMGIFIQSYKETANYIDNKLTDELNNLRDVIKAKYEDPTIDHGKPEFFNFKPGMVQYQYDWELGSKMITIGLCEEEGGSEYRAVCYIYNDTMMQAFKDSESKKSEQVKKAAANNF
ncbi:hypothetical protein SAMN06265348_109312 [Pedobacter westerhofensis]|uniref:Lipoprotein n=1 Tax=Pedobacter westerhofensis TaxID=425512 RepID=A0A521EYU9_9SPHI|nr:hypothetical protein [Pedobacter westerhofensis]SMO89016.1 hypothetical protein SAMN06265348_109312 [Pedobacter westerhofensis]